MKKRTFILSDQTRNYYGFVVLTAGIDLGRFKKNPVLLYNHKDNDDPNDVIGLWDNVRIESGQLLADANLDEDEEKAKRLGAKIDKGYIKGASIRLDFKYEDVKLDVEGYEGIPVVTKCEIMEASIVAIPNNKNAVRLYIDGKEVEDKSMALSLSLNQKQNEKMKELILIAGALKLGANATEAHAVEAINSLVAERDALKMKVDKMTTDLKAIEDAKVTEFIKHHTEVTKKLKAEQVELYTKLAKQDFESTKAIVESLQPYTSITEQLSGAAGKGNEGAGKDQYEGWDYKKFQKEAPGVLLNMREKEPEKYKKLWEAAFPEGKFNG